MSHILIVDDEESICWALRRLLTESGHRVTVASSAEEAFEHVGRDGPHLMMLDIRLPGMDGLEALDRLRRLMPDLPIVIMTAFGSLATAVRALGHGAFDYLIKPFDLDQAAAVVSRAMTRPTETAPTAAGGAVAAVEDELLGRSAAMQEVFKRIALVARTDASVLITGESGTGKELVARAIHRHSLRAATPLVPVNLAALSPTLVESELFGHASGSFTGATGDRQGLLELADGGTVFFDEAGDIPTSVQVKLLRVLEQDEVTPVGATEPRRSKFRVIAATNRDLRGEIGAVISAKTCTFVWPCSRFRSLRCAIGSMTFRCWPSVFLRPASRTMPKRDSPQARSTSLRAAPGLATFASSQFGRARRDPARRRNRSRAFPRAGHHGHAAKRHQHDHDADPPLGRASISRFARGRGSLRTAARTGRAAPVGSGHAHASRPAHVSRPQPGPAPRHAAQEAGPFWRQRRVVPLASTAASPAEDYGQPSFWHARAVL